jgi:LPPG:FO 2-phospho-L-lactate transferase
MIERRIGALESGPVVALCGGIGGAKLALGLYRVLRHGNLTVVANTGDDFEHLGLHISPDIDTIIYTLGGLNDLERGWGRANESWNFITALAELGGETWFELGDRDLAIHIERTRRLRTGETLTAITADVASRLGISGRILPTSDDPVRTHVQTRDGTLSFQDYFVQHRCAPIVCGISFYGADKAEPTLGVLEVLADPALRAVIVCPSNPYLSIDPILVVPKIRAAIEQCTAPIVAVSPIIAGKAVKGPTAKIMAELGIEISSAAVARHYHGLLDGLVLDEADASQSTSIEVPVEIAPTLMVSLQDREALARRALAFADRIYNTNCSTAAKAQCP